MGINNNERKINMQNKFLRTSILLSVLIIGCLSPAVGGPRERGENNDEYWWDTVMHVVCGIRTKYSRLRGYDAPERVEYQQKTVPGTVIATISNAQGARADVRTPDKEVTVAVVTKAHRVESFE